MSEATCGAERAANAGPGYRFAHPGYAADLRAGQSTTPAQNKAHHPNTG